jgi:hypothetical protein
LGEEQNNFCFVLRSFHGIFARGMKKGLLVLVFLLTALAPKAQENDSLKTRQLDGVTIKARRKGTTRMSGPLCPIHLQPFRKIPKIPNFW